MLSTSKLPTSKLPKSTRATSPPAKFTSYTSRCLATLTIVLSFSLIVCDAYADEPPTKGEAKTPKVKWTALFDGKTLKDWERTNFGGEGEVAVEDGAIVMQSGGPITGVHYKGKQKLPTTNYELTLEAMKARGDDFFCGLTFPVDKSFCSFIVGGWAGGIVGISSIDGMDASENETTRFQNFKQKQWYKIRVRVTKDRVQCWIDKDSLVDVDVKGRKLDVRPEVDLSKPLGICAFETVSKLRHIQVRQLTEDEIKEGK
jgi:hypothetical protein